MGVIRNFNRSLADPEEDDWVYLTSDGEDIRNTEPERQQSRPQAIPRTRRGQRTPASNARPEPTFKGLGARGKSHKKARRYLNANLAMTELGSLINEEEIEEVSIDDFIECSPSPFTMLMETLGSSNSTQYSRFMNCTEDEQNRLLGIRRRKHKHNDDQDEDPDIREEKLHSLSPDARFSRIDSEIRRHLLSRHIPLGILSAIEDEIVEFFRENPEQLYSNSYRSSYNRFLVHALCQYLNLDSQSVDCKGKRLTYVKNRLKRFVLPNHLLSEYLQFLS